MPWQLMASIGVLAAIGLAMAGRSAVSDAKARRLREQTGVLLEDVGALQSALLPPPPKSMAGVAVSVAYRPASGPAAGGDFHDVLALDGDRIGVLVGDVSGHGRRALAVTPLAHYTVRAYLEAGLSPRDALALADRVLDGKLGDDFATVLAAIYDPSTGRLQYSTAGHPVPILTAPAEHTPIEILTPPPVGIGPPTGFRQTTVPVPAGTLMCFFTDGLAEARRTADPQELLGSGGIGEILAGADFAGTAEALLDRVVDATDGRRDDMTACVLKPDESPALGYAVEELELAQGATGDESLREFLTLCGITPAAAAEVLGCVPAHTGEGPTVLTVERDPAGARATFAPRSEAAVPTVVPAA